VKGDDRHLVDARRLSRRSLPSLLRYKFLHEYGYDKGAVVVQAIVDDICAVVRNYYRRDGDLEPGQLIYNAAAKSERAGRGKTIAKTSTSKFHVQRDDFGSNGLVLPIRLV
jgi:Protein of unknown function (DUF1670)